jgi:hypothetical protein
MSAEPDLVDAPGPFVFAFLEDHAEAHYIDPEPVALIMRAVSIPRERRLFAVPALRGSEGLPESLAVSIPAAHAICPLCQALVS